MCLFHCLESLENSKAETQLSMWYIQMKLLLVTLLALGTSIYHSPRNKSSAMCHSSRLTTPKVLHCEQSIFFETDEFVGSHFSSGFVVN